MKNTVKKVLCTFIAVVAAVTSTLVFTGCGSKKATSDVSIPDYTFLKVLRKRKVRRQKKVKGR